MKEDKRAILGWVMFDWANSSYSLVISTAVFPVFFLAATPEEIPIFNFSVYNSSLYAFSVTFSYILISLLSPVLSGIADHGGKRKFFMRVFTTTGSLACILLYFFTGSNNLWIGIIAFIIATTSHAGSLVFYDAYLPDIALPEHRDRVSARGYAFGYIGSVLLLIVNLLVIQKPEWFGISSENHLPVRLAFLSVGIWWFSFSQYSFIRLPEDQNVAFDKSQLFGGLKKLKTAWNHIRHNRDVMYFLFSFFCYSAGVQTVIYLASAFAQKELHFESSELILIILILQIVAIGGAYLFAYISKLSQNKTSMMIMLCIWILICVLAYLVHSKTQFYLVAALVGMVLGGIQALSRSAYSKIIPTEKNLNTCLFSFYDTLYYLSIISGTFTFGIVGQLTGSMRNSVISLGIFFIAGLIFLSRVKKSSFIHK
ncbi:MAG: MFS transporter [Saprospiraceae bacterium]|jgi:UMF1 family MFS transporter|nr:MFS transporter [Saprospiraceae bacterium]